MKLEFETYENILLDIRSRINMVREKMKVLKLITLPREDWEEEYNRLVGDYHEIEGMLSILYYMRTEDNQSVYDSRDIKQLMYQKGELRTTLVCLSMKKVSLKPRSETEVEKKCLIIITSLFPQRIIKVSKIWKD